MNAHQRRVWMNEKHMRLPLGSEVIVNGRPAKIMKHDSERPHLCIVEYTDERGVGQGLSHGWVPVKQVKPLKRLKVRPWYRVMREQRRSHKIK